MPNPKEFADKFIANQRANLSKAGISLQARTLGDAAVDLLRQGKEATAANLREYLTQKQQTGPNEKHYCLGAIQLLDELTHHAENEEAQ